MNLVWGLTSNPKKFAISCSVSGFNPRCLEANGSVCGSSSSILEIPDKYRLQVAKTFCVVDVPRRMLETRSRVRARHCLYILTYVFVREYEKVEIIEVLSPGFGYNQASEMTHNSRVSCNSVRFGNMTTK